MPTLQIEQEEWMKTRRSRNVYIKTAEGRKARIDPSNYLKKMEEKVEQINLENSKMMTEGVQDCETHNNLVKSLRKATKTITGSFIRRRENAKTRNFTKTEEFRPWSSCKSEMLE